MRLSYAQNLEDYHLDLAFAGQTEGVYVDVGGGHPVADNVSFWFYLKGWRGLIVEPQAALASAYRHIRPRDIVYEGLAGAHDGAAEFHVVDKLHGLSSMLKPGATAGAGGPDITFSSGRFPMRRLDRLIAEAGFERVDFLKIDVEGAEAQVLGGIDLAKLRPRVLVIEAVNPGNLAGDATAFEPQVLQAGYEMRLNDGLNRFYVAREATDVAARLPAKPAPWDRVQHLWDEGRAPRNPAHIDHALAQTLALGLARSLEPGLMAQLPTLDAGRLERFLRLGLGLRDDQPATPAQIAALVGNAEFPGPAAMPAQLDELFASDRFRAALGRIACMYDGGHIVDEA